MVIIKISGKYEFNKDNKELGMQVEFMIVGSFTKLN